MSDKKSIKPVEPSKRPGTPVPKCFRDAKTGEFVPVREAGRREKTAVVESIKKDKK